MTARLLSPTAFKAAWSGTCETLQGDLPGVPASTRAWLAEVGLPSPLVAAYGAVVSTFSFARLARGVRRLTDESFVGPPVPSDWAQYLVIGDEEFPNGSAQWCIQHSTGHVLRVDVELAEPLTAVSGNVATLCSGLLALVEWSRKLTAAGVLGENPGLHALSREIIALDADAGTFWQEIGGLEDPNADSFRMLPGSEASLDRGPTMRCT